MPSYRAQLGIAGLRPGHRPERVMEAAVDAVGSAHVVEANQLDIVAGTPRIAVRFTVDPTARDIEDRQALQAAANMRHAVGQVAVTGQLQVLRRVRGRWEPVG
ncbi:hypothetical protein LVY72_13090 [Arthrobacter sp. I2-34]|uniref:Asp23/Gls24 family envelope stress response protein n=1 Tax=Arthrobacter hankyongi TaxID=2904801 RepID=A0ABS9L886_9MICC|nr:hypothetical protein [Arthrobacter hankyongi]MCG2622836.1 hypothetical protein [Arthrobacter hankyongi]